MSESPWGVPRATSPAIVSSSSLPTSPSRVGLSRRLSWNRDSALAAPPRMDPLTSLAYPASNPFDDDEEESSGAGRTAYNLQQPSETSLVADFHDGPRSGLADDQQRLTSAAQPFWGVRNGEGDCDDDDEERSAMNRRRRKYVRTSLPSASLGGSALRAVSRNLRRMSIRVVDLASSGTRDQGVKLEDEDDEKSIHGSDSEEPTPTSQQLKLRGRALGMFSSGSRVRRAMYNLMLSPWTEPSILALIIIHAIVLVIESSRSVYVHPRPTGYFKKWEDFVFFALFVIYTLEMIARILTTGLVLDPDVPWTSIRIFSNDYIMGQKPIVPARFAGDPSGHPGALSALSTSSSALKGSMTPSASSSTDQLHHRSDSTRSVWRLAVEGAVYPDQQAYQKRTLEAPFKLAIEKQRNLSQQGRPYLRHSWHRIDFVSVLSYWIMFGLAIAGLEAKPTAHIYIFRALSVLRISRLLAVTRGTATIMRSLKTAAPLLSRVAVFILFAMVLFSIIGVQAFKGSFRRSCQLLAGDGSNILNPDSVTNVQTCGGHINSTNLAISGFIQMDGQVTKYAKGYICPLGQVCMDTGGNPIGGLENFDNIIASVLQIVILAGVNGWSPVMYQMMDAEFFVSCLFFIAGVIVLNLWLLNLFVAVITNTFSAIRQETKRSAFGANQVGANFDDQDDLDDSPRRRGIGWIMEAYNYTTWFWVLLALISLGFQASRTSESSQAHINIMSVVELYITIAFDVEIIWRIAGHFPDWREFFLHRHNLLDMTIAVTTAIIQIPFINNSPVYRWLTIFQLARFYRVILFVPRMRPLLLQVFGNLSGLVNMTLFLLLTNLIGGLIAMQLFRGDIAQSPGEMTFYQTYNAFLAMYQIFSSENWPTVLYGVGQSEIPFKQAVIGLIFISIWFLFANMIMLQMYIAVINENFEVAEEQKRTQQIIAYVDNAAPKSSAVSWLERWNPYRFVRADPKSVAVEALPSNLVLPLQKSIVQDGRARRFDRQAPARRGSDVQSGESNARPQRSWIAQMLGRFFAFGHERENIPLTSLRNPRPESIAAQDLYYFDEVDRHLDALANMNNEDFHESRDQKTEELAEKSEFILAHPTYDRTLWVFSQKNPVRQFCQTLVAPSNGDRIFGTPPTFLGQASFQLLVFLAVLGGIIVAAIANPVYRRDYVFRNDDPRFPWYDVAEATFGLALLVEFIIKVVADGFIFTPNAYVYSIWNIIDFLILISLLVNLSVTLIAAGSISRLARSLKALRALRLITLFGWMRTTFHSIIFAGAARILDAAVLAMLYMIPYAVWGLNIFNGRFFACNDGSSAGKADCVNEFISTPLDGQNLGFLAPRSWQNPKSGTQWSFDTFAHSLLILFEIVSEEGWINVLSAAMAITGLDTQPSQDATQANSIFFVVYNLLGGVVILTLFVSIIIGNFSTRSGMALLTTEQRQWIDLQKLLRRQRPSKRPKARPASAWRGWCFDRAVHKHGWWSRGMTIIYCLHILNLTTQTFYAKEHEGAVENVPFLLMGMVYLADVVVRLSGLGRSYWKGGWNIFDIVVAFGTFITTSAIMLGSRNFVFQQLQKLFLVSIAFKLIQKFNNLNQLFKTAVSSLPVILKLFSLWLVLFLFFGIADMEVFGLTRWYSAETHAQNYRSLDKALVMLAFMSTGEGWNQYMHDFATNYPHCTEGTVRDPQSDCGSTGWAFSLFITWNVLSMYIFVNMFTGVVVENFSFVFQLAGTVSFSREEMRSFKKVWSEFDPSRKGYLPRSKFVAFFSRLSGVFEVRIYPPEANVRRILEKSRELEADVTQPARYVEGVDINRLQRVLGSLNLNRTRQRRDMYNRLLQEALLVQEPGKGISFTNVLLLLAHYKLIDDEKALRVDEMLRRQSTKSYIKDRVNVDRVRSMLRMTHHRRKFLAGREERARQRAAASGVAVPEILVDDGPSGPLPPSSSRDITLAGRNSIYITDTPRRPTLQVDTAEALHTRRVSSMSALSADLGSLSAHSRDSSPSRQSVTDQHAVLQSLSTSVWGEMMVDAADDEE